MNLSATPILEGGAAPLALLAAPKPIIPPPMIPMLIMGVIAGLVMLSAALLNPISLPFTISQCLSCIMCLIIVYFVSKRYKKIAWVLAIIFVLSVLSMCISALGAVVTGSAALKELM